MISMVGHSVIPTVWSASLTLVTMWGNGSAPIPAASGRHRKPTACRRCGEIQPSARLAAQHYTVRAIKARALDCFGERSKFLGANRRTTAASNRGTGAAHSESPEVALSSEPAGALKPARTVGPQSFNPHLWVEIPRNLVSELPTSFVAQQSWLSGSLYEWLCCGRMYCKLKNTGKRGWKTSGCGVAPSGPRRRKRSTSAH